MTDANTDAEEDDKDEDEEEIGEDTDMTQRRMGRGGTRDSDWHKRGWDDDEQDKTKLKGQKERRGSGGKTSG